MGFFWAGGGGSNCAPGFLGVRVLEVLWGFKEQLGVFKISKKSHGESIFLATLIINIVVLLLYLSIPVQISSFQPLPSIFNVGGLIVSQVMT